MVERNFDNENKWNSKSGREELDRRRKICGREAGKPSPMGMYHRKMREMQRNQHDCRYPPIHLCYHLYRGIFRHFSCFPISYAKPYQTAPLNRLNLCLFLGRFRSPSKFPKCDFVWETLMKVGLLKLRWIYPVSNSPLFSLCDTCPLYRSSLISLIFPHAFPFSLFWFVFPTFRIPFVLIIEIPLNQKYQ